MALMSDDVKSEVKEFLQQLERPVTVAFYPVAGDPASDAMQELWHDLSDLNPKLVIEPKGDRPDPIYPETPEELESSVSVFSVDGQPTGIRYLGFPGGHEFGAMLEALRDVSRNTVPELTEGTRAYLEHVTTPIHLEVFVTPT